MTDIAGWSARHGKLVRLDRDVLLADELSCSRAWVIAHSEFELPADVEARLEVSAQRLLAGESLAYIRGWKEFRGLRFGVSPAVLVPRPETELLVETCLERAQPGDHILDLGTGSGAIAVSLVHARPDLRLTATDVSSLAVEQARSNARGLGVNVEFTLGDWFAPFAEQPQAFDIVVSNPPYIAAGHHALESLKTEPYQALVSGTDGLDAIKHIVTHAPHYVRRWLLVEHGFDQGDAARRLMSEVGFTNVETLNDLAGLPRVTCGQRP